LATASVPRLPLAPGLFSTTNGWPSLVCSSSASSRATMSGVAPAANGTISFTPFVGQSCAVAGQAAQATSRIAVSSRFIPDSLGRSILCDRPQKRRQPRLVWWI
jgi:hypothetical protein